MSLSHGTMWWFYLGLMPFILLYEMQLRSVHKVYCEKCWYSSAEGACIEACGRGEGVSPPQWGVRSGEGVVPPPQKFFWIFDIKMVGLSWQKCTRKNDAFGLPRLTSLIFEAYPVMLEHQVLLVTRQIFLDSE